MNEDVRRFAEDPASWGEIDPRSGFDRVLTDAYCVLFGPVPSFTQVSRLRLDPDSVAETIHEVRDEIRGRSRTRATWNVGSSATPGDLVDRLRGYGLGADDHATALVLDREPEPGPSEIEARRVASLDEYRLAGEVTAFAFGETDERAEWEAIAEERFAREQAGHGHRTYLAFLDGQAVASARVLLEAGCPAGLLISGAVLPEARGRGAYRALVRARWDDAVAEGFGALCVQAGAMSRPILERLGFERVAEVEILGDQIA